MIEYSLWRCGDSSNRRLEFCYGESKLLTRRFDGKQPFDPVFWSAWGGRMSRSIIDRMEWVRETFTSGKLTQVLTSSVQRGRSEFDSCQRRTPTRTQLIQSFTGGTSSEKVVLIKTGINGTSLTSNEMSFSCLENGWRTVRSRLREWRRGNSVVIRGRMFELIHRWTEQRCRRWCTSTRLYILTTMSGALANSCFTMESLPNEIVLLIFNYLKTSDIVFAFFFLKRRYSRLIEQFRPFSTSINLADASTSVFNLYSSLLFRTYHIDRSVVENLRLDCSMLQKLSVNEQSFPRLQSLSIVVRKSDDLGILLKYFPLFTNMQQLYIRSDVCCCDRILFEESVKQNLFESSRTQLRSLTFATPPCYSISLQDIHFEQSLFTNLTVSLFNCIRLTWPFSRLVNCSIDEWLLFDSQQCSSSAFVTYPCARHSHQSSESVGHRHSPAELESSSLHLSPFDFLRDHQEYLQDIDTVDQAEFLVGLRSSIGHYRWTSSAWRHIRAFTAFGDDSIRNQIVDLNDFHGFDRLVQDAVLVSILSDWFSFVQSYLHAALSLPSSRLGSIDPETRTHSTVDPQLDFRTRCRSLRPNDVHETILDLSSRWILSLDHLDIEMAIRFNQHLTTDHRLVLFTDGPSSDD